MADAAGVQAHEDLALPRAGEVDLLHRERRPELLQHRRADLHLSDSNLDSDGEDLPRDPLCAVAAT